MHVMHDCLFRLSGSERKMKILIQDQFILFPVVSVKKGPFVCDAFPPFLKAAPGSWRRWNMNLFSRLRRN